MAKKKYDVVVKVGEYQKDGETKGKYENVGVVLVNDDDKPYILLNRTFNPAGVKNPEERETVLLSLFEPKAKEDNGQSSI